VDWLRSQAVELVVEIRTIPRSRANPQYNAVTFAKTLSEFEIGYEHIAELGGFRGRTRYVPADVNAFWENQRFTIMRTTP
jgi:uncharacterized protein (DUF488 family)